LVYQHKNGFELFAGEPMSKDFMIYFYFTSLETLVSSESLIVDFSDLIATIGGNLGLFLGFSCLSIYIHFLEILQKKIQS
jgi:hypothetical protein